MATATETSRLRASGSRRWNGRVRPSFRTRAASSPGRSLTVSWATRSPRTPTSPTSARRRPKTRRWRSFSPTWTTNPNIHSPPTWRYSRAGSRDWRAKTILKTWGSRETAWWRRCGRSSSRYAGSYSSFIPINRRWGIS